MSEKKRKSALGNVYRGDLSLISLTRMLVAGKAAEQWCVRLRLRLREPVSPGNQTFLGLTEVDDTHMEGVGKDKHPHRKLEEVGGPSGKVIATEVYQRCAGKMDTRFAKGTSVELLAAMVPNHVYPSSYVLTNKAYGYAFLAWMGHSNQFVMPLRSRGVDGMSHPSGLEPLWTALKHSYYRVYHQMGQKHVHRFIGKRLIWGTLIAGDVNSRQGQAA